MGDETDDKRFVQSSSRFSGAIVASEQSVPLWGPLFDLTGNHVHGVPLAPDMLTLMRLVTGTLGDSSR